MLKNLNFLNVGQIFPPISELKRFKEYRENLDLWNGEHSEVYKEQFQRIKRFVHDNRFDSDIFNWTQYETVFNPQRLMSIKTADLLSLDELKISINDEKKQKTLNDITEVNDIYNILYLTCLDMSRYGTGLIYNYKSNFKSKIDITQPFIWYKIVNPRNIRETLSHVICIKENENKNEYDLYVEIHEKGKYTTKTLRVKNDKIISVFEDDKVITTEMSDFAIVEVNNLMPSDKQFGESDYNNIDSLVSEILVRISQINKILDKFSEPNLQGPASALAYNHKTQEYESKLGGRYFTLNQGDPSISAIVWESNLEANFKQIELLLNLLYQQSEMSGTLLGDTNSTQQGTPTSGVAYKHRMETTVQRLKRFRIALDKALRKAISIASEMMGNKINENELIIEWKDSLKDEKEQADIIAVKSGNKPVMSQKRAIMLSNDFTEAEAEEEYNTIVEEEMMSNPTMIPSDSTLPLNDTTLEE